MAAVSKFREYEIRFYDILDSTQEEAKRLVKENQKGNVVVTAITQTAGRGRQGREWISDEGNLFFSLIISNKTFKEPQHSAFITPLVIAHVLEELKLSPKIKWPNDILLDEKKLSGILIEKFGDHLIIGVGINNTSHPEFLDNNRTSCALSQHAEIENDLLLQNFLTAFDKCKARAFNDCRIEYINRLHKLGETVELDYLGRKVKGVISDINNEGELLLQTSTCIEHFKTGEIFDL